MSRCFGLAAILLGLLASGASWAAQAPKMEFLTRDGCVNTDRMRANLDAALKTVDRPTTYPVTDAETLDAKDPKRGYGTRDLFGLQPPEPGEHPHLTRLSGRSSVHRRHRRQTPRLEVALSRPRSAAARAIALLRLARSRVRSGSPKRLSTRCG